MSVDSLVINAGRLRILTALAAEQRLEFVQLRQRANLTDGNLASHARRLQSAGLLAIEKHFRGGKPVTTMILTPEGKLALQTHLETVMAALRVDPAQPTEIAAIQTSSNDDEWVD